MDRTIAKSCPEMASITNAPSPGMPKKLSKTRLPRKTYGRYDPALVMMGISAFFNTCRNSTARAKGLAESVVLFRHVLKNALIPIITSAGSYLPYVFLGSLVFESFFGIPGLGAFVIEAISGQDFAIVRSMVFLGALLYIASYVLIDVAYTWADPRVRLT